MRVDYKKSEPLIYYQGSDFPSSHFPIHERVLNLSIKSLLSAGKLKFNTFIFAIINYILRTY